MVTVKTVNLNAVSVEGTRWSGDEGGGRKGGGGGEGEGRGSG